MFFVGNSQNYIRFYAAEIAQIGKRSGIALTLRSLSHHCAVGTCYIAAFKSICTPFYQSVVYMLYSFIFAHFRSNSGKYLFCRFLHFGVHTVYLRLGIYISYVHIGNIFR